MQNKIMVLLLPLAMAAPLSIIFLILKVSAIIDWEWIWVLSPVLAVVSLVLLALFAGLFFMVWGKLKYLVDKDFKSKIDGLEKRQSKSKLDVWVEKQQEKQRNHE